MSYTKKYPDRINWQNEPSTRTPLDEINLNKMDYALRQIDQTLYDMDNTITGEIQDAEAWAKGTKGGVDVPSTDPAYHNNAKYYSEQASEVVQGAEEYVEESEAWAKGTKDGQPVSPSDPTYNNNAKYYAELAEEYAHQADPTALANMSDVSLGTLNDGQRLKYNSTSSKWANDFDDYFNNNLQSAAEFVNGTANISSPNHDFGKFFKVKDVGNAFGISTNMWLRGYVVYQNNTANPYTSITGAGIVFRNDVGNAPYVFYIGGNGTTERPYSISSSQIGGGSGTDTNAVHWTEASGYVGKNLLRNTNTSKTINDVTFTVNADASVTVSTTVGGATASTDYDLFNGSGTTVIPTGNYILNGCPSGGSSSSYQMFVKGSNNTIYNDYGSGVSITGTGIVYCRINIPNGKIITEPITFYPMIRLASVSDSTYEPYLKTNKELADAIPVPYYSFEISAATSTSSPIVIDGIDFNRPFKLMLTTKSTSTVNLNTIHISDGTNVHAYAAGFKRSDGTGFVNAGGYASIRYANGNYPTWMEFFCQYYKAGTTDYYRATVSLGTKDNITETTFMKVRNYSSVSLDETTTIEGLGHLDGCSYLLFTYEQKSDTLAYRGQQVFYIVVPEVENPTPVGISLGASTNKGVTVTYGNVDSSYGSVILTPTSGYSYKYTLYKLAF